MAQKQEDGMRRHCFSQTRRSHSLLHRQPVCCSKSLEASKHHKVGRLTYDSPSSRLASRRPTRRPGSGTSGAPNAPRPSWHGWSLQSERALTSGGSHHSLTVHAFESEPMAGKERIQRISIDKTTQKAAPHWHPQGSLDVVTALPI